MVALNGGEYNADGSYAEAPAADAKRPKRILYSYFTAGAPSPGWLVDWRRRCSDAGAQALGAARALPGGPPCCSAADNAAPPLPRLAAFVFQARAARGQPFWKRRCCWRGRRWWRSSECFFVFFQALAPAASSRHMQLCCLFRRRAADPGHPRGPRCACPPQGRPAPGAAAREQPAGRRLWAGGGAAQRVPVQPARGHLGAPGAAAAWGWGLGLICRQGRAQQAAGFCRSRGGDGSGRRRRCISAHPPLLFCTPPAADLRRAQHQRAVWHRTRPVESGDGGHGAAGAQE